MKSKRFWEFASVLIVLAILIPWLRTSNAPEPKAEGTAVAPAGGAPAGRLAVDGVWLGMTEQQVLAKLGEPHRVTPSNADYEQWDYSSPKRLTLMLDAGDKVVTVDGASLTRDGVDLVSPGMPLTAVEQVLGKSRESLDTIPDSVNAGFSTGGQLVHLEHRQRKVTGRVTMTVDYSVVRPPTENLKKEAQPVSDGIVLREPGPLREPETRQ